MPDNVDRSDVPIVVGFVVVLLLSGGVIVAAADGLVDESVPLGSADGESIAAGVTAAENETESSPDSSPTESSSASATETQTEPPPETTEEDSPTETPSGSSGDDGNETDSVTETATEASEESGDSGSSGGSSSGSSSSADSSDSSGPSGDDGDTDTSTPAATETATSGGAAESSGSGENSETETPESDGGPGLFECEEDAADGSSSCQIRLTEEPDSREPSWEYDVPVADNYAHWILSHTGVFGIQFVSDNGQQPRMLVFYGDGASPDLPGYTANGIATSKVLTDAMPGHGPPPEGYEWEPLPDRSYEYGLEISDGAARTMLSHDDVRGVKAGLDGGVTFYVTSEEFAEEAPEEIEGRSIEYSVVDPVSAPDQ